MALFIVVLFVVVVSLSVVVAALVPTIVGFPFKWYDRLPEQVRDYHHE